MIPTPTNNSFENEVILLFQMKIRMKISRNEYVKFFQGTVVKGFEHLFQDDLEKRKKTNEMPNERIFECDFYVKPHSNMLSVGISLVFFLFSESS